MVVQLSEGHRRNAITYTSLICAAEKSGQWQLALELFHRVTADSVAPNAAIFNAALSACAQGAPWMQRSLSGQVGVIDSLNCGNVYPKHHVQQGPMFGVCCATVRRLLLPA